MSSVIKSESEPPAEVVDTIVARVREHVGADYSGPRVNDLLHHLSMIAEYEGATDFAEWLRELVSSAWDERVVGRLISAFTVGETYFRRDPQAWEWIWRHHLGPLVERRRTRGLRRLTLWSAACCTGEEAYGLLFLLDEILGGELSDWQIDFIASDVNTKFLAQARDGCYGAGAFRSAEAAFRDRYFEPAGRAHWRVARRWRERIRFMPHNLVSAAAPMVPGCCDLLLCRNALMYFAPAEARAAVQRLHAALSRDGVLLLAAVEASLATSAGLPGAWAGENYAIGPEFAQPETSRVALRSSAISAPTAMRAPAPRVEAVPQARERPPAALPTGRGAGPAEAGAPPPRPLRFPRDLLASPAAAQACFERPDAPAREKHAACLFMARHCADANEFEQARTWLTAALALNPGSVEAYLLDAWIAHDQGQARVALAAVGRALYLEPDAPMANFLHASILRQLDRHEAALRALAQCRSALSAMPAEGEVGHSEGMSAAQLARMCDQLLRGEVA